MPVFDPSQTHGHVIGGSIRLFEQDNVLYDVNHRPVELLPDGSIRPLAVDNAPADDLIGDGDYGKKTTEQLKQICTVYGIDFKTRDQAIKALEGR
jgi:hypothetical protein